jgi:hypothetical protein
MNGLRKCGIYTQWSFCLAMKKNDILSFASKWMELENIILSEVNQAQKTKNCMLGKYSNVVGLGSHDKGRVHTGGMGIGRKLKT